MTTTLLRHARPALLALAVALPATSFAQSASAPPPTTPPAVTPVQRGPGPMNGIEQQITTLHGALHITPALEPQWRAMATVMRENAAAMGQQIAARDAALPKMTALADMQSYQRLADQNAANMQRLVVAFSTLYNAMSDDQRKATDAYFRREAMQRR